MALPNDIAGHETSSVIETHAGSTTVVEFVVAGQLENLGPTPGVAPPVSGSSGSAAGIFAKTDSSDPAAADELAGIDAFSLSSSSEVLDATDFADTPDARTKLLSLSDGAVRIEGWVLFDDAPQESIRAAATTGASVWLTARLQPTNDDLFQGFRVECKASGFSIDAQVDGAVGFSADLVFNGKPVND